LLLRSAHMRTLFLRFDTRPYLPWPVCAAGVEMVALTVQSVCAPRGAAASRASTRAAAAAPAAAAAAAPRASRLSGRVALAGAHLRASTSAAAGRAPRRAPGGVLTRALTITETVVDTDTPTGKMRTYVFKPSAPGKYPGIVFYSEIFQARARTPERASRRRPRSGRSLALVQRGS
jgi:hypothetical protein